ncbi:hypothetical protein H2248_010069 [Termitomyces sp. 'cryptogamus']|nr:hypothetical protein H2248_010069 [Termitomyces sp. 'cryptogamus']
MSRPRVSGLVDHIAFFLILQATRALKLDNLPDPDIVRGETISVSWASTANDPDTIDLFVSCDGGLSYEKVASSVSTTLGSFNVTVPTSESPSSSSLNSCNLQARATSDHLVLDGITFEVVTSTTTSSESTSPIDEASPMSAATSEESPLASSSGSTINFVSDSIQASASLTPTSSAADVLSFTFPFQLFPTKTFSSQPAPSIEASEVFTTWSMQDSSTISPLPLVNTQSTRALPISSADATATSSMSSSSTTNTLPSANSPTQATTKPIGPIIGAVIGGLLGLLILAALVLFLCRQLYRRRRLSPQLSLMRAVKPDSLSVPFSKDKEEALLAAEETPSEALNSLASDSQHLGSSSHDHYYPAGRQSSYSLDIQLQPTRFSESTSTILVPVLQAVDEIGDQDSRHTGHSRSSSSRSSKSSTQEEGGGLHRPWSFSPRPMGYDRISQRSSDDLDIDRMGPETREQRRDALLERMRRVLDGEQSV